MSIKAKNVTCIILSHTLNALTVIKKSKKIARKKKRQSEKIKVFQNFLA